MSKYAIMPLADYVESCEKIREKTETSNDIKSGEMPQMIDEVYKVGKQAQYDEFWDGLQINKGEAQNYEQAFCGLGWNDVTFKPKYDLIFSVGYSGNGTFSSSRMTNLAQTLEERGLKMDTTLCGYFNSMFQNSHTVRIPEINCAHSMDYGATYGLYATFSGAKVVTIDKLIVHEDLLFRNTFNNCVDLTNIVIEGVIGRDIDFKSSTKLSKDSWISIMTHTSTTANITITGSLLSINKAFETSEGANDGSTSAEWLNLIATKPNCTIKLV